MTKANRSNSKSKRTILASLTLIGLIVIAKSIMDYRETLSVSRSAARNTIAAMGGSEKSAPEMSATEKQKNESPTTQAPPS